MIGRAITRTATALVLCLGVGSLSSKPATAQPDQTTATGERSSTSSARANSGGCASLVVVSYDGSQPAANRLTLSPKTLPAFYPSYHASQRGICWVLVVTNSSDLDPFKELEVKFGAGNGNGNGGDIFAGNMKFNGDAVAWAKFIHEPKWGTGSTVSVSYTIEGKLQDGSSITADPDIIIIKP